MIASDELIALGFSLVEEVADEYCYKKRLCSDDDDFSLYTHLFNLGEEPYFHKVFANIHGYIDESRPRELWAEKFYYIKSATEVRNFINHCNNIKLDSL
jgi:hypothetical protein